jgi:hypothetical protein
MNYFTMKIEPEDYDQFLMLAERFFNESDNSGLVTFRKDKCLKFLESAAQNPDEVSVIVAFDKNNVMGGYSIPIMQNVFSTENIGDLYQFYVAPEHRKTYCSRELAFATHRQFKAWNCAISYSYVASGLTDNQKNVALFKNLWQKIGYMQSGIIMINKEVQHGRFNSNCRKSSRRTD